MQNDLTQELSTNFINYNEKQKLIDIMFEIGLMIHNHPYFKDKNDKEVCNWISEQLKKCGFKTKPMGSSWGVLIND